MQLKFLGTGTSQGVPVIGSTHPVCLSQNPKDKRLRSSAIITTDQGKKILIDCGPDFRQQMLCHHEDHIEAVLITHEHNDHIIGLDDLRPLIFRQNKAMPLYCHSRVALEIKNRFPYAFTEEKYPGAPSFRIYEINEYQPFKIDNIEIIPIGILHGKLPILGYRIGPLAYITDASFIDTKAMKMLNDLEVLVINALRLSPPHHSHFTLNEALEIVSQLSPKHTYITHISHHLGFYDEIEPTLPFGVHLAYDGLVLKF